MSVVDKLSKKAADGAQSFEELLPKFQPFADALATNTTMRELKLEQPSKTADTMITTLPVQQLNGSQGHDTIDLAEAGAKLTDGSGGYQPCHRHACGCVGAVLGMDPAAEPATLAVSAFPPSTSMYR